MKVSRRRFPGVAGGRATLLAALLMTMIAGGDVWSQSTTIRIVVPFGPGGAASVLARTVANAIEQRPGFAAVVENRPGGGAVVATEAVAHAAADGNTLLIANTAFLINAQLRKRDYDPLTSFEPICSLVSSPSFIAVNSASPYYTLADLVDAAREKPGALTVATLAATGSHLALEMLKRRANVDFSFAPYPGSPLAVAALLSGQVTSMADNYAAMGEYVSRGELRVLATFSRSRIEAMPSIPTIAESGYKDFGYEGWFGLFAPANSPNEAVSRLARWTTDALQAPEVRRGLSPLGLLPSNRCGADFADFLRKQYDDFGRIIREANIKEE
jgi:tripartite-type tricarboxylate transporter receptor subunit TctC